MEEVLIFWLAFLTIIIVVVSAHCVLVNMARGSKDQRLMPEGWLELDAAREWPGQDEGVETRMPAEAHLKR
ncbi:hypothetical protein J7T55_001571 [Diaporthe amygdali]|uniref:uncharacterized protein n=1 Tax=Phomopsis amygdali TaxID=1214568 RepID=UPI0022FDF93E|nr:uncharacterized protein J7T55_001571 [Diaporthe amygdali]KAJ0115161.1 hypothetical protein J7T55_001571 [Diaporthe amygdali]